MSHCVTRLLLPLTALALSAGTASAQFENNTSQIPQGNPGNNSNSENVDFADVDLDGDWDVVFADGGDDFNDRNRMWINQGGDQGGTEGFFEDDTNARVPNVLDQSRDVEFADIEGDGDFDLYISNTAAITNQSNRWWINMGGLQNGGLGFYDDQTASRWVGLGGPGSSISPAAVLGSGGFIDWSCDCDFGDLDNDGDLDLVHSTYGGSFGGSVPTRIFLNDGDGFFEEFNPSGFQLGGTTISNGNPGIWADGTHQANTTNANGNNCDVSTTALDIDLGDIDGDFDLDILHGARSEVPRMFASRLEGSTLAPSAGGALGYRDVTGMVFPPGYATSGNYEQEMGDLDGDGDLDIYGMNWPGLSDAMYENDGTGIFAAGVVAPGSSPDDNEADFFDYNNDGNLDVFVANFSGQDRLYRGNGNNMTLQNVTGAQLPSAPRTALDADCCDVDGDGDYDVIVANDNSQGNWFFKNLSNVPDTHPPYIPNVEQASDRIIGSLPTVVRAHVYDNAPYYITWYNPTFLAVSVDGGPEFEIPMQTSAGQIFRGEIPGYLCGTIEYRVVSEDQYGNRGSSGTKSYTATGSCDIVSFCSSSPNSTGGAARITSNGALDVAANSFELLASSVPNQFGIFFYSVGQTNGGAGTPFGNGLQCVGAAGDELCRLDVELASDNVLRHSVNFGDPPSATCTITPGSTWHFQAWFRDPAGGGASFDLSDGLSVSFH